MSPNLHTNILFAFYSSKVPYVNFLDMSKISDNSKPQEIAIAILRNKIGKVLIINRVHPERAINDQKLTWVFPGGAIENDEKPEEALTREVRAETGYDIKVLNKISERNYPQPFVHLKYYLCDFASFRSNVIEDVHEVDKIKWVEPSELTNYFTTDMDPKVAKYLGL